MNADSDSGSGKEPYKDALDVLIGQNQKLFAIYDARRGNAETKAAGILTADVAIAAATATAVGLIKRVTPAMLVGLVVLLAVLAISVIWTIYTGSAAGLRHGDSSPRKLLLERAKQVPRLASDRRRRGAGSVGGSEPGEGAGNQQGRPRGSCGDPNSCEPKDAAPALSTESVDYRRAAECLDNEADRIEKQCMDEEDVAIRVRLRAVRLWQQRREDAHRLAQAKDRGAGAAGLALGVAILWGGVLFAFLIIAHL